MKRRKRDRKTEGKKRKTERREGKKRGRKEGRLNESWEKGSVLATSIPVTCDQAFFRFFGGGSVIARYVSSVCSSRPLEHENTDPGNELGVLHLLPAA